MSSILEGIDFSGFERLTGKKTATETPEGILDLPLDDVIEDPDQPRRVFPQEPLEELAASIRQRGILQPITVRPGNEDGKYVIVMGARRYRASLLAKAKSIRAIVRGERCDAFDQMIENIQREALSHGDTALFIRQQRERGMEYSAIAAALGKSRSWVSLYASYFNMPEAIRERADELGIRVAYELYLASRIDEDATLAYIETNGSITQREAMALAKSLKGGSPVESGPSTPVTEAAETDGKGAGEGKGGVDGFVSAAGQKRRRLSVAIIVQVDGRAGRLLTDQAAGQGSQYGVVSFDNGANIEEVALSRIGLLEIMQIG
jgi:ParB family chromosome partitioning protein